MIDILIYFALGIIFFSVMFLYESKHVKFAEKPSDRWLVAWMTLLFWPVWIIVLAQVVKRIIKERKNSQ